MTGPTRKALQEQCATLIDCLGDGSRDDAARDALLQRLAEHQRQSVPAYGKLWQGHAGPMAPALPTDVFRFVRVAGYDRDLDVRVFRTSGTTDQQRGQHPFRDLSLYDRAAHTAARYALFPDVPKMRLLILAPDAQELVDSSLSYMLSRFVDWFGTAGSAHFVVDDALDLDGLRHALTQAEQDREPVALLGTSFAFVHADDGLDQRRFSLPHGSRVMQTGGFKGRSRSVEPGRMLELLSHRFGVGPEWIVQEYGMTELSSQLYETNLRHAALGLQPPHQRALWVPGWMRAQVVDPESLAPVGPAARGLLRLDDPANLDSVSAIQTSDQALCVDDGVQVLGRAAGAVPRGCSLAMDAVLGKHAGS